MKVKVELFRKHVSLVGGEAEDVYSFSAEWNGKRGAGRPRMIGYIVAPDGARVGSPAMGVSHLLFLPGERHGLFAYEAFVKALSQEDGLSFEEATHGGN